MKRYAGGFFVGCGCLIFVIGCGQSGDQSGGAPATTGPAGQEAAPSSATPAAKEAKPAETSEPSDEGPLLIPPTGPAEDQQSALPPGQGSIGGSDWPQWRGPNRDGHSLETGLLTRWPAEGPPVLWKVSGGEGFSSLSISNGRAYTMVQRDGAQWAICLDAETGEELWQVRSGPEYFDHQGGNGPRSTPTIDDDRVYTLDSLGSLLCLNNASGEILWQRNILEDFDASNLNWGVSTSPLIEDDLLLVNVGGPGASVVAFDKYTGEVVWKAHDDVASYSSPIAITKDGVREVVFFAGRAIFGVSPADGRLHWRHEWRTLSDMNIATPIWSDPLLFVSSGRGTGAGAFRLESAGSDLEAESVWKSTRMENHFNSCVLVGEYLYGYHSSILKCMRLEDGEEMWADRSVGKGSLLYADGHLFIVGEQGDIAVAEATPEGYREHGQMRNLQYKAWTPPSLAHGRLYLRDHHDIACVDLRP